jgi:hypothetical protein
MQITHHVMLHAAGHYEHAFSSSGCGFLQLLASAAPSCLHGECRRFVQDWSGELNQCAASWTMCCWLTCSFQHPWQLHWHSLQPIFCSKCQITT